MILTTILGPKGRAILRLDLKAEEEVGGEEEEGQEGRGGALRETQRH